MLSGQVRFLDHQFPFQYFEFSTFSQIADTPKVTHITQLTMIIFDIVSIIRMKKIWYMVRRTFAAQLGKGVFGKELL